MGPRLKIEKTNTMTIEITTSLRTDNEIPKVVDSLYILKYYIFYQLSSVQKPTVEKYAIE